jgi:hypothetical protein
MANFLKDNFKALVGKLLPLIRDYGIIRFIPKHDIERDHQKFAALVHEGWKQAQIIIVREIAVRAPCYVDG